ncbi:hypothetical protein COR50_16330 [Chitinophaga caeni]|uniref:Rho-binding antiterminator n=1 Tax=Chitinophaga caeni TaxID=2029983 RepID=A0A291QXL7_9BACT|nr:hypothetical protein [Chitinophaga caeni]ATL48604.1 hypothetical protein COR50_16330 [Chitinophaga caeni]
MNNSKITYTPIDCNYYDRLEAWATGQILCHIIFKSTPLQGDLSTYDGYIKNLFTINGEEFMELDNGRHLRLDQLVSVNGIALVQNQCKI